MSDKERTFVSFPEDEAIVARYKQIAEAEATSASAIYRRALRFYLASLPANFANEVPAPKNDQPAA